MSFAKNLSQRPMHWHACDPMYRQWLRRLAVWAYRAVPSNGQCGNSPAKHRIIGSLWLGFDGPVGRYTTLSAWPMPQQRSGSPINRI